MSILLVESHPRLRRGINRILERDPAFRVISEASHASEAVRLSEKYEPEIVLTEIALGDGSGIEAARQIRARRRETGIVFLSMHSDVCYVVSSMKAGGRGYVLKDTADHELCEAIHAVKGRSTFHSPVVRWLLAQDCVPRLKERPNDCSLSKPENEVIQLLAKGKTLNDVALLLRLDSRVAEAHRFQALCKIYLGNREPMSFAPVNF